MKESEKNSNNTRDIFADILRGFAILLVVWGHCIQENNGATFSSEALFFDDKLYQFIYSFHMPLFALIAGYYAYNSIAKADTINKRIRLLVKRITVYFIPIVFWTLEEYIREAIIKDKYGVDRARGFAVIPDFLYRVLNNHWFLWAMIVCFVFVWIMHCFLKDNVILYACIFVSLFFIPDGMNMHTYKFLLPFYVTAFYYNQFRNNAVAAGGLLSKCKRVYEEKTPVATAITGTVFLALFAMYRKRAFIYVSGYRITKDVWYKQFATDVYRFAIGMAGCLFFICLWSLILKAVKGYRFPVLCMFGRYSLGVYLISGYITILGLRNFTDAFTPNDLRATLIAIPVAFAALGLAYLISLVPLLRKVVGR